MSLNTYLEFDGTCAETFGFYQSVLGAVPGMLMTFGEMPEQPDWVTPEVTRRVAHGQLTIGDQVIMASDTSGQEPFEGHKGFTLHLGFTDMDKAREVFESLSAKGTVLMPFEPTFWSKCFGVCRDQFGIGWMVDVEEG